MQSRKPNSSFQQRGLHNWDTTNIANESTACIRPGPKIKNRPMATESEGRLEFAESISRMPASAAANLEGV